MITESQLAEWLYETARTAHLAANYGDTSLIPVRWDHCVEKEKRFWTDIAVALLPPIQTVEEYLAWGDDGGCYTGSDMEMWRRRFVQELAKITMKEKP